MHYTFMKEQSGITTPPSAIVTQLQENHTKIHSHNIIEEE
jgi:hypothetical protein